MEINPYAAGQVYQRDIGTDQELPSRPAPENEPQSAATGQDRVDLIAAQNLVAGDIDIFDLETALQVLGQVEKDLTQMTSPGLENLFHYDNLRQASYV